MSGIPCTFCEGQRSAVVLMTWLGNGASVNMCEEDLPVALINILATDLGVEPGKFYENVKRYVDREARKAAQDAPKDTDDAGSPDVAAVGGESTGTCEYCGNPLDDGESHLHAGQPNPETVT